MEEQVNKSIDLGDDFNIDIKKIFLMFWSRKVLMTKIFIATLLFFIAITFIMEKMWVVDSNLYVNKSNSTNFSEVNPFAIEELGIGIIANQNPLADELELIKSPLVLQKVIKENDLRYKKVFGIIPTKKTGEYLSVESFLKKKKANFENKNGTSVLLISYKDKDKELAYNVVNSIIKNYIELHKEINSEKSKSDKKIIETEYQKAKADLRQKVSAANGLPNASLTGTGQLAAMSAFSRSAQSAISNIKGQYLAGEKSRVEIGEEEAKVTQLASKLEWAKMVEEMSDSSKVLVIKEPTIPRDWEYDSPNLLINIIVGIIMGVIFAFWAVIISEIRDKKLTYMNLGENIIYDFEKEMNTFITELISNSDKKISFILFENLPATYFDRFKTFSNISIIKADISPAFKDSIKNVDSVVTFASIHKTNSESYKLVKKLISSANKEIMYEVLV